ncbi:hypothetical protein KUCAC02_013579 [Chaenocephalus aceratus]|uniref:Uncharacterized protein n=1 Tax=Chaenocephalus aceratus TaxID=36190 RepID=A0ACB9WCU3_CHAAC|nr:hypothetical protein KUCAC02_013579 [Chaenocephalus aceratus]
MPTQEELNAIDRPGPFKISASISISSPNTHAASFPSEASGGSVYGVPRPACGRILSSSRPPLLSEQLNQSSPERGGVKKREMVSEEEETRQQWIKCDQTGALEVCIVRAPQPLATQASPPLLARRAGWRQPLSCRCYIFNRPPYFGPHPD